jgi:hypothetical protein
MMPPANLKLSASTGRARRQLKLAGGIMANMKKGAAFTSESVRINDEVWLPSQVELNASIKVLLVKGININQVAKYSDYHKFETEIKESKIDEIK